MPRTNNPRSSFGGAHELGQNYLCNKTTLKRMADLVGQTQGDILEIGPGRGALTRHLASLGRPVTAVEIDEHNVSFLTRELPTVTVKHADVLTTPLQQLVIVGNLPFHLTTPILRKLLHEPRWQTAVLLTQWEVARKRAGTGHRTMMSAQHDPWFTFELAFRVPAEHFSPRPNVDGGVLIIRRRCAPQLPAQQRRGYERFVKGVFTARGRGILQMLSRGMGLPTVAAKQALAQAKLNPQALPRELKPEQWVLLWQSLGASTTARRSGPYQRRR